MLKVCVEREFENSCLQSDIWTVIIISGPICKLCSKECCAFSAEHIFNVLESNFENCLRIRICWTIATYPIYFQTTINTRPQKVWYL